MVWTKKNRVRVLLAILWFVIIMAFYEQKVLILSIIFMISGHELGHLYAAKYFGIKTDGFTLVPFLGGVAEIKQLPKDRWEYFLVYFWGPFVGCLMSLVLLTIGLLIHSPMTLMTAGIWAYINFLNLLPVMPLDGGNMYFAITSEKKGYFRQFRFELISFLGIVLLWVLTGSILMTGLVMLFSFVQGKRLDQMENEGHFNEGNENRMNGGRILATAMFTLLTLGLAAIYVFSIVIYREWIAREMLKAVFETP